MTALTNCAKLFLLRYLLSTSTISKGVQCFNIFSALTLTCSFTKVFFHFNIRCHREPKTTRFLSPFLLDTQQHVSCARHHRITSDRFYEFLITFSPSKNGTGLKSLKFNLQAAQKRRSLWHGTLVSADSRRSADSPLATVELCRNRLRRNTMPSADKVLGSDDEARAIRNSARWACAKWQTRRWCCGALGR